MFQLKRRLHQEKHFLHNISSSLDLKKGNPLFQNIASKTFSAEARDLMKFEFAKRHVGIAKQR